jgi:hypothetical protein
MDRHGHKQNKEHIVDTENFIYIYIICGICYVRYELCQEHVGVSHETFVTGELRC